MRSEHRAPFIASIIVSLACAGVMLHAVRTDALGGLARIMPAAVVASTMLTHKPVPAPAAAAPRPTAAPAPAAPAAPAATAPRRPAAHPSATPATPAKPATTRRHERSARPTAEPAPVAAAAPLAPPAPVVPVLDAVHGKGHDKSHGKAHERGHVKVRPAQAVTDVVDSIASVVGDLGRAGHGHGHGRDHGVATGHDKPGKHAEHGRGRSHHGRH